MLMEEYIQELLGSPGTDGETSLNSPTINLSKLLAE